MPRTSISLASSFSTAKVGRALPASREGFRAMLRARWARRQNRAAAIRQRQTGSQRGRYRAERRRGRSEPASTLRLSVPTRIASRATQMMVLPAARLAMISWSPVWAFGRGNANGTDAMIAHMTIAHTEASDARQGRWVRRRGNRRHMLDNKLAQYRAGGAVYRGVFTLVAMAAPARMPSGFLPKANFCKMDAERGGPIDMGFLDGIFGGKRLRGRRACGTTASA